MNAAVTESITPETTEFQRSVLRAMPELAGSNTSNEIAKQAGEEVCGADAVIADWKREHAPAAPTIAPADSFAGWFADSFAVRLADSFAVRLTDSFAVWLADTKAGCAGQRAIDAAKKEAERLEAEAAEMIREAAETLQFGMTVAEIIQFADQRNASTSTSEEEFGLAELLAAAYEAVSGKRVA